jgi:hypothetical protein
VGDSIVAHLEARAYLCRSCGAPLGFLDESLFAEAIRRELPLAAAGPKRGENYERGRFFLRVAYCPGCATQLHADVGLKGELEPFVRLEL